MEVVDIDCELVPIKSVVKRYFIQRFAIAVPHPAGNTQEAHEYVYQHTNGICIVGLAPKHPALREGRSIVKVDYNISKRSRLDNKVYGKQKKRRDVVRATCPSL